MSKGTVAVEGEIELTRHQEKIEENPFCLAALPRKVTHPNSNE